MPSMLVVCDLDEGCTTRDGTVQPKGTAFDRVATDEFPPSPGCVLIEDDGRPLYVQNSGAAPAPPPNAELKTYANDADAIADGLPYNKYYSTPSGYTVQLKRPR